MNKIPLFLTYLLLAAAQGLTPAIARGEGPMGNMKEEHGVMEEKFLERLDEKLNLSEVQKGKIKAIMEQSKPDMKKLHEEMTALRRKTHEAIRETLSLEQKERFDMMSMKMRMGHGEGFRRPEGVKPEQGRWVKPHRNEWVPAAKNTENEGVEPQKEEREPESVEPDSR